MVDWCPLVGFNRVSQPKDLATSRISWEDGNGTWASGTFNLASNKEVTDIIKLDVWQNI